MTQVPGAPSLSSKLPSEHLVACETVYHKIILHLGRLRLRKKKKLFC